MPSYKFSTQNYIIIARCAIHNFISMNGNTYPIFEDLESNSFEVEGNNMQHEATSTQDVVNVT